jgi:hypothetical protein
MRSSTTHSEPRRNVMPFLAAVAVIAIAAVTSLIAITRNSDSSAEVEQAKTPEVTTNSDEHVPGETNTPVANTPTDAPAEPVASGDEPVPACFASGDSAMVVTFSSPTAFTGAITHLGVARTLDGEATGEGSDWRIAAWSPEEKASGTVFEQLWNLETQGMFLTDDFLDAASCDDIPEEVAELEALIDEIGLPNLDDLPEPGSIPISPNCLAGNGNGNTMSLDFEDIGGERFTGVYLRNDSIQLLAGVRLSGPTNQTAVFLVALQAIGSAEDGSPIVTEEIWTGIEDGMTTPDEVLILVDCADVADRIDPALDLVGENRPPFPAVTDFSCWVEGLGDDDGDQIASDDNPVTGDLSGVWLRGDSILVFTAVALGPEVDNATDYLVAVEAIGAAEDDEPVVTVERWAAGPDGTLNTGDGASFGLVWCSEVGPELASAVDFVGDARPPAPTL